MSYTLKDMAALLDGESRGDCNPITGPNSLAAAKTDQIALLSDKKYLAQAEKSAAGCILTTRELAGQMPPAADKQRGLILVARPEVAWSKVLAAFAPAPWLPETGIHPTAVIHPQAQIGANCRIGAGVVIGRAKIGVGCILHPNVVIGDDASLSDSCELWPGAVVRECCTIGQRCILHPNAVIGADGFGYQFVNGRHEKVPHIGHVEIGDDVEIGAGSTIDRGKFGATVIGRGTKIDNQVQIAHNCRIGQNVIIVAQVGLAGSVVVEDYAVLAGGVGVGDHLTIGQAAKVGAFAAVMNDVPPGVEWVGVPAQDGKACFRQIAAIRRLPDLIKAVRELEGRIKRLEQPDHD